MISASKPLPDAHSRIRSVIYRCRFSDNVREGPVFLVLQALWGEKISSPGLPCRSFAGREQNRLAFLPRSPANDGRVPLVTSAAPRYRMQHPPPGSLVSEPPL